MALVMLDWVVIVHTWKLRHAWLVILKPCKDLAIGFSDLDVEKYELHIKSTVKSIELAKNNNRQDMVEKHINILNKYEEILGNIKDGNIIFGRSNRIKV